MDRGPATGVMLLGGRAGGHKVNTKEPQIWVAMLNGAPRVLPNRDCPDVKAPDDLLFRVRPGQWSLYEMRGEAYQWLRDQQWPVGGLVAATALGRAPAGAS